MKIARASLKGYPRPGTELAGIEAKRPVFSPNALYLDHYGHLQALRCYLPWR
jgi:hypothetical protein